MENEILAAEIYLHPVNTADATAEIDAELSRIEEAVRAYSVSASMLDYSVAVLSGILAGAIDAFFVKEAPIFSRDSIPTKNELIDYVKKTIVNSLTVDKPVGPVMHRAVGKGLPVMIPGLEAAAKNPTPVGMGAAVLLQAGLGGMFAEKNNSMQLFPDGMSKPDGVLIAIAAVIVGIMKWLADISSAEPDQEHAGIQFKGLQKLCGMIRSTPVFYQVVHEIERWQRQLPNEIKCNRKEAGEEAGVEKTFYSFFAMMAAIPAFSNTNLRKAMDAVQEGKRLGLDELPIMKSLSKQAIPVLINEVVLRTFFFVSRLVRELSGKEDLSDIKREEVLPFGNATVDRLIAISSMTFSAANTMDAAMHAAIDVCGNELFFVQRFAARFNFVAAGRAAVAVVKEISNEKKQAELVHMKRLLTEAKTAKALEIIQAYQEELEHRVSEYIAEDVTVFLEGFDCMDRGLRNKDSDAVIKGNVMIQRVLGREPQFTNQKEFDDLMDSDIPLIL